MSDDTKALTAEQERRLRTLASSSIVGADVRALLVDRDALAERCEKLHEALRDECMYYRFSQWGRNGELRDGCNRCIQSWRSGTKERHAEGCLAAPKDAT